MTALTTTPRRAAALQLISGAGGEVTTDVAAVPLAVEAAGAAVANGFRDVSLEVETKPDGSARLRFRAVR